MKKQLIILTILFLTITVVQGQTNVYHPFPDSAAEWREGCSGPGASIPPSVRCYDIKNYLVGDTILGVNNYSKIYQLGSYWVNDCSQFVYSWDNYIGAIRQDTIQKKVFSFSNLSSDTLLYDFNLSIGDTLSPSLINDTSSFKNFVSSIDSILIGNSYRKRFWISTSFAPNYAALIEGIGSTLGLFNQLIPPFEWGCGLSCFSQNGMTLFPDTNTICQPVGIIEYQKNMSLKIAPNPFNNVCIIQTDKVFDNSTLIVYNSYGQIVKQIKNISGQSITLHRDNLPSGIYFLQLTQDNEILTTDKIIITDN